MARSNQVCTHPGSRPWPGTGSALAVSVTTLVLAGCGPMYGAPDPHPAPPAAPAVSAGGPPSGPPGGPPAAAAPAHADEGRAPRGHGAATLSRDAQILLDEHNRYRAKHCAPPLTWSPELAAFAQQWAKTLRDKGCAFEHSRGTYGENLAAGTSGALTPSSVVAMWYDEIKDYSFAKPAFSMQTGHFTQVVWRGTRQLGCAMTQCKGMDIWVCEYDPPGNWEGKYREHVQPTNCK